MQLAEFGPSSLHLHLHLAGKNEPTAYKGWIVVFARSSRHLHVYLSAELDVVCAGALSMS